MSKKINDCNKHALKKGAYFSDIHFGKKANSEQHNQDCLDFLEWMCREIKNDPSIEYVAFLGDWHETRSAINIDTINYSYRGAKLLSNLGLPIYCVIGNHDLYHRHTREVHSLVFFRELENFIMIEEPMVIEDIHNRVLFVPYLFHDEYSLLTKYDDVPFWAGHFEFKGFEVTGNGRVMPTGPDPKDFSQPRRILSGHFHKRQVTGNIAYIGNPFPMDFGDAGDVNRGFATYDHTCDELKFINWENCPKYTKTTLSALLGGDVKIHKGSRIKCLADISISYEESLAIHKKFVEQYDLREFAIEESVQMHAALSDTDNDIDWNKNQLASVDEVITTLLSEIDADSLDNEQLVSIYNGLI